MYNSADKLLQADSDAARSNADYEFYTSKVAKINAKTDNFKAQLWRSRYLESRSKFIAARQELEKRLLSAKYNKVWDQIL